MIKVELVANIVENKNKSKFSGMKKNLNSALDQELSESLLLEANHLIDSMDDSESKEAIAAFMEKRKPNFTN